MKITSGMARKLNILNREVEAAKQHYGDDDAPDSKPNSSKTESKAKKSPES